ncbi:hypothetical protein JRO89_XS02G0156100 [Xanthoceras sorbifolium]|uniref:Uncharacterized protein n=1 Tax=Xanthoceras sorbifolium TaxID=99658 RepID=A0ABQ8IFY3_9ROSI|nr:hypothetical protein JRO89_XS02G0156100 [Xanthoceras sorbifolium]
MTEEMEVVQVIYLGTVVYDGNVNLASSFAPAQWVILGAELLSIREASKDGNKHMYLLAFGYGNSKNNLAWEWFLESLKRVVGNVEDLVIISYRHASIESGVAAMWLVAVHCICA